MPPADDSFHGSNCGSDVLTNLDSDIFKPSASTLEYTSSIKAGLLTNNELKLGE